MKKIILILAIYFPVLLQAQGASKGFDLIESKEYANAKNAFEKALASDPADVAALVGMARTLNFKGWAGFDPNEAMEFLEQAEVKVPTLTEKEWKQLEKYKLDKASIVNLRGGIERAMLNQINEKPDEDAYYAFMQKYPKSVVYPFARKEASKTGAANAKLVNTIEGYTAFLIKYADSDEYAEILRKRDQMALAEAIQARTGEALRNFLRTYPNSTLKAEAEQQLHSRAFEEAKTANTSDAMVEYISEFPTSVFLDMAKTVAKQLREEGK